ncbi:MAG: fumarate hydratase, partial [Alphaproteobacteria bacterium]
MAEIRIDSVAEAGMEIMRRAAIDIPDDYRDGIRNMVEEEDNELSRFVLEAMIENWQAAEADRRAMCADTGLPRYYVKIGNEARMEGGFIALERALREATARATQEVPLRPNRVHPLTRKDNNNN